VIPLEEFVGLVTGAGVDLVADIRRFPRSRRHPQFSRANLERDLPIAYEWLGEQLGGFRDGGYEEWMRSSEFARGIEDLERLATEHTVAFMCAEGVPWKCHRLYVARALASRGHRIAHLLPGGRIEWEPSPLAPPDR
jgi:uncharacterized protein (DUF488 family)